MARKSNVSRIGWISDYTPNWKVYQVSYIKSIDEIEVRPERVALLESKDVDSYWESKRLPSFKLSSDEELLREVFGEPPTGSESRSIVLCEKPEVACWDESTPSEDIEKLRKEMVESALLMNLEDSDELAQFTTQYGSLTGHWSYDLPYSGEQSRYLHLFNELGQDAILPQYVSLEPLWYLARRIALFRTAKQLADALRKYDKRAIRDMVVDIENVVMHDKSNRGSLIWFKAKDVPDSVYQGLRRTGMPRGFLSFEPIKKLHFMVAARMALTGILNEILENGITVKFEHYLREPEIRELRRSDENYLQHSRFRRFSRISNSDTKNDSNTDINSDTKPPLFALTYTVQTPEVLTYIDLLNQRTLSAKNMKICEICQEPFTPKHGNQDYCGKKKHSESEKRQHRRIKARERENRLDENKAI